MLDDSNKRGEYINKK